MKKVQAIPTTMLPHDLVKEVQAIPTTVLPHDPVKEVQAIPIVVTLVELSIVLRI